MKTQPQALATLDDDRLTSLDFARLATFVGERTGIKMPSGKHVMLEGRLRRRVRAIGMASLADYCRHLFAEGGLEGESEHLINAVTTNKTDFFREPGHFDHLVRHILPGLAEAGTRTIRCWSAACSTGAEPYTLAMLLDRFVAARPGLSYGILATDLDTEALAAARRGVFPLDMLAPVPADLRRDYLRRSSDPARKEARVCAHLRATIGFARLNLMDAAYPVGEPMDLIFCRNVLIYFDRDTQKKVLERLVARLRPGGHLFLGHSETIAGYDLPLLTVGNTIFRRKD